MSRGVNLVPKKYICSNCKREFISKTVRAHKSKYCSEECSKLGGMKEVSCGTCSHSFHVYKNVPNKNYFCSRLCYHSWQRLNVTFVDSEKRRVNSNSKEAIKKRKGTWKRTGRKFVCSSSPLSVTWRQYYKSVDSLTGRKREKLVQDWDGYDFYDNEYIKENLNLSKSHSDFPTLDHIIPRSLGFTLGLTVEEITSEDNLVWTKRTLNTSKGNREVLSWLEKKGFLLSDFKLQKIKEVINLYKQKRSE